MWNRLSLSLKSAVAFAVTSACRIDLDSAIWFLLSYGSDLASARPWLSFGLALGWF